MPSALPDAVWRACKLFRDTPAPVVDALAQAAQTRNWNDGAVLFQRGDPGDYLLVVQSGGLRLSLTTPQGQELTLGHAGPGDIVGELAVVDDQPRSADATAVGALTAQVLTRPNFMAVADAHPDIYKAMLRHLAGMLRHTNDRLESIALYRLEARLARFLLAEITRQHGVEAPARVTIDMGMGQGELALMLGASRPKVNRALQKLTEAGVLIRDGKVLHCDVSGLAAQAEPD